MSATELNHLIKMINQISANIAIGADDATTARQVAGHITRFWAPTMKKQIIAYAASNGSELSRVSQAAVLELVKQ